jgi:dihydrofolate reductase
MGRLVFSMSISLDGFVDTPSHSLDWVLIDEELHSFFNDQSREVHASLYGRRMYEVMAVWETMEANPSATPAMLEFARIWKGIERVVFSRTLDHVDPGSRLVRDDAVAEVERLKRRPGYDMDVGGPTFASTLIRHGLVDEFRLFVHPVVLGSGTRYFPPLDERIGLRLVETRTFGSGVVYLRYDDVRTP